MSNIYGPPVSVIMLNRNGIRILGPDLKKFIKSVLDSDYSRLELIFVDNGSDDGSVQQVEEWFGKDERFSTLALKENQGFAEGNNQGMNKASKIAKYIVLLNNDIIVERNWLKEMIGVMEQDSKIAASQPKIIKMGTSNVIDSTGGMLDRMARAYDRGSGETDEGQYDDQTDIFYAKGAAILMRRSCLNEVGLLDPDHFIYYEETDLCWRFHLAGYDVKLVPSAKVYHKGSAYFGTSVDPFMLYARRRHQMKMMLKNYSIMNLTKYGSLFKARAIGYFLILLVKGRYKHAAALLRAYWWNIRNIVKTLRMRKKVQSSIRRVSDDRILERMMTISEYNSIKKRYKLPDN